MFFRITLLTLLLSFAITGFIKAQSMPDTTSITFDTLIHHLFINQPGYHSLSAKAKLSWDDGKSQQDFSATIRMKKDSIVWMSITGPMNVEAARVLITPDTFQLLNKINTEYIGQGFSYLNNWLLFPVSFPMFQQILAGEKPDIREKASTAVYQDSSFIIYAENNNLLEKTWVNSGNYTISKIMLKDKLLTQQMSITFDSYNLLEGKPFSYHRVIEVNRDGAVLVLTIDFTKVKLNENLNYPFEVSEKYKH
jgi:Domain of unknown function (DUF4292)